MDNVEFALNRDDVFALIEKFSVSNLTEMEIYIGIDTAMDKTKTKIRIRKAVYENGNGERQFWEQC